MAHLIYLSALLNQYIDYWLLISLQIGLSRTDRTLSHRSDSPTKSCDLCKRGWSVRGSPICVREAVKSSGQSRWFHGLSHLCHPGGVIGSEVRERPWKSASLAQIGLSHKVMWSVQERLICARESNLCERGREILGPVSLISRLIGLSRTQPLLHLLPEDFMTSLTRESMCERVMIGLETSHEKVREAMCERGRVQESPNLDSLAPRTLWQICLIQSDHLGLSNRSVLSNQRARPLSHSASLAKWDSLTHGLSHFVEIWTNF